MIATGGINSSTDVVLVVDVDDGATDVLVEVVDTSSVVVVDDNGTVEEVVDTTTDVLVVLGACDVVVTYPLVLVVTFGGHVVDVVLPVL